MLYKLLDFLRGRRDKSSQFRWFVFLSLFSSLVEKWFSRFELNQEEIRLTPSAERLRIQENP